jgi:uncharacterized protein (TIGR02145 family)
LRLSFTGAVTDIDGNIYKTVKIGDQWWMAENLKVTHYRNGDPIAQVTGNTEWANLSSGAWCVYNNQDSLKDIYGLLYNWYAVDDSLNSAPEGWYVPTLEEWQELVDFLGGTSVAGGKLKESGFDHWDSPNTGADNESGFSALPGGYRYCNDGSFLNMGSYTYFWSTTGYLWKNTDYAWPWKLYYLDSYAIPNIYCNTQYGFSVRCVKDITTTLGSSAPSIINDPNLLQNYPNPFNPSTTIEFTLPKSEFVELKVYYILGKEIFILESKKLNQGRYTYTFDGSKLASGIYYYQLTAGDPSTDLSRAESRGSGQIFREVRKMILLR